MQGLLIGLLVLAADGAAGQVRMLMNEGPLGFDTGMRWLRNDGSGQFTVAATYSFPAGDTSPVAVRLADADEDGRVDVLVALSRHLTSTSSTGGLWVALGDGLGGFVPLATHELLLRAGDATLAELNGDGHLDVAYLGGNVSLSAAVVANGLGDGTFANNSAAFSVGIYASGLAAGDFDRDGDVDLATGFKYYLQVRTNDRSGAFTLGQNIGVGAYIKGIAVGDLEGDGDLDLLATSGGSSAMHMVTNGSSGHFGVGGTAPASVQCYSVLLADTSGDGFPDAWAGDVTSGQLFSAVSNCLSVCGASASYCTAVPNSTGLGAAISYTGSRSVLANGFTLNCVHVPLDSNGYFYFGSSQANVPFGNGIRCVGGSVLRLGPTLTAGSSGEVARWVDFSAPPVLGVITGGVTEYFQYVYRDMLGGVAGLNLSNGLSVTFCN